MEPKKFLASGFLAGLVIFIVWMAADLAVQQVWYYDPMKIAGMRAVDDPLMYLFWIYPWVLGFAMTLLYPHFGESFAGDYMTKGRTYGFLIWLVSGFASAYVIYTSMDYPIGFMVSQFIGSLLYCVLAGIAIARIDDML